MKVLLAGKLLSYKSENSPFGVGYGWGGTYSGRLAEKCAGRDVL